MVTSAQAEVSKLGPIDEELRDASETIQVTAAQTSHDLRSGLGVLKLAMSGELEEPMQRVARAALKQMDDIIEQVLWASTIEDPERSNQEFGAADGACFDFAEVVRESVATHQPHVDQKNQQLELFVGEGLARICGPRILAVQIANNLIQNAYLELSAWTSSSTVNGF